MIPSFEYVRARSVDEAITYLSAHNARVYAGGTDLLGCMRDRIFPVERIVSIWGIKGLLGINETTESITVGSLTTIAQLATSPVVTRFFPVSPWRPVRWRAHNFGIRVQSVETFAKSRAAGIIAGSLIA